jgi:hypothetical protein
MTLQALQGLVRRRLLVNFRVDPAVVKPLLPAPFQPKLVGDWAIAGICLIRLEQLRPRGLPAAIGLASENAAHRIAVTWTDEAGEQHEGVYIPRRDTGALWNAIVGGRLFPGEHHHARFRVRDDSGAIDLRMDTDDGAADVRLKGHPGAGLPSGSCFASLEEASSFFAGGSVGYSPSSGGRRLDGLRLRTLTWHVEPLEVEEIRSSFYADSRRFPPGSIEYDCTLLMRDIPHEWWPQPLSSTARTLSGAAAS